MDICLFIANNKILLNIKFILELIKKPKSEI